MECSLRPDTTPVVESLRRLVPEEKRGGQEEARYNAILGDLEPAMEALSDDELKAKTGRSGSKETFKQISLAAYAKIAPDKADTAKRGVTPTRMTAGSAPMMSA